MIWHSQCQIYWGTKAEVEWGGGVMSAVFSLIFYTDIKKDFRFSITTTQAIAGPISQPIQSSSLSCLPLPTVCVYNHTEASSAFGVRQTIFDEKGMLSSCRDSGWSLTAAGIHQTAPGGQYPESPWRTHALSKGSPYMKGLFWDRASLPRCLQ